MAIKLSWLHAWLTHTYSQKLTLANGHSETHITSFFTQYLCMVTLPVALPEKPMQFNVPAAITYTCTMDNSGS